MNQKTKSLTLNAKRFNFVFFGTDDFSVIVLEELKKAGLIPALLVTAPDRKKGRGMILTPPPAKLWAQENNIPLLQPEKLDKALGSRLQALGADLFIVASYGNILPKEVLKIPKHGTLNVHPSLLPLFRGPSPLQHQILENAEDVGVTIMLIDEKIDHGPIVAQEVLGFKISDLRFKDLRDELAHLGGKLLASTIPDWVAGNIDPQEQDHAAATYTKMITKESGLIDMLQESPEMLYRKWRAFTPWPGVYFFKNNRRIKITDAELKNGSFVIKKVIPEGKREIDYSAYGQN
ncbi:MAG: methionyl-tRNA formyltransferase [Parcubacteria group bacterium]|nr:methionyl-tRNA formyltransferase [Parcubacteria group bacterium]